MIGAKSVRFALTALLLGLFATGCDDGVTVAPTSGAAGDVGAEATTIRILLTDAPNPAIGEALVDIGRVEILSADDDGHIVLSEDGTDGFVNLLDLQGDATRPIAEADIEPGSFSQLRLFVEAARVKLADGYSFRDGSTEMDLKVPSGAQTGIKLNLRSEDGGPLEVVPGETVLVLDFDVSESFVLLGNPNTPAGIRGVNFKPTIRVTGYDVAASISGTISTALEGMSVEGLTVRATPTDPGTVAGYQSETGTAVTDEGGAYTISYLVPGSYEVTVDLEPGLGTDPESRSVILANSEAATGADFEIIDITGSIAGTVSTEVDGVSVAGLTVTATPAAEGGDPLEATTGDDGTYLFDGVLAGAYTVTVAVGEDLLTDPASAAVSVANSEDVTGVDFEILEALSGSISGTVSTALPDVSVVGLTVTADPAADGAENVTTTTGEGGAYSFPSLPAGNYTLSVEVGDGLATDPATRAIELAEKENETGADFSVVTAS